MRGPKLSVYPKGVLLETYRRRLIALRKEGFNDDFMAALEEVHRQLETHESLCQQLAKTKALLLEALESVEADARFAEHYSPYGADIINKRAADIRAFLADRISNQETSQHG